MQFNVRAVGEEVIIGKGKTPVVKIVALPRSSFKTGILEGQVAEGPDFFEPMSEEDLGLWEGGGAL